MLKYIETRCLIHTDEFIKPSINETAFTNSHARNFILFGERCSGKSTFLYDIQYRSLGTENPIVFTRFDSDNTAKDCSIEFIAHYYELEMASKILNFICYNYKETYSKYFSKERERITKLMREANRYLNFHQNGDVFLDQLYSSGALVSEYVKRLRKYAPISTLGLIVDRFDWINGSSLSTQKSLSTYFNIFDKSIITTDDQTLIQNKEEKEKLTQKGYQFVEVNLGKDQEFITKVIKARIDNFNADPNNEVKFPTEILTDDLIKGLTCYAQGNINIILKALNEIYAMILNGSYSLKALVNVGYTMGIAANTKVMRRSVKMHLGNI